MYRPTWVQIDLSSLRHNISVIKTKLPEKTKLMAVVKADAYGHGMVEIARHAVSCGVDMLCVAIPEEGIALRAAGVTVPVLVLGAVNESGMAASVEHGLIQTVYDAAAVGWAENAAAYLGKTALLDLKIDTGMNRIGARSSDEIESVISAIKSAQNVTLHGAYTHYAVSEEDDEFTKVQFEKYLRLVQAVKTAFPNVMLHTSNSAGIFLHDYAHLGGVRCGIALYGSAPAHDMQTRLRPILSWKTNIVQVKEIGEGESVSYGRTYFAKRPTLVATLPVGYGDGYKRILGNRAHVLVGGKAAPVIGRVCMDQIMVDVTGIDVKAGDEAVLIGKQGDAEITPWDMALWADTIPYEITLSISARVPKVYING